MQTVIVYFVQRLSAAVFMDVLAHVMLTLQATWWTLKWTGAKSGWVFFFLFFLSAWHLACCVYRCLTKVCLRSREVSCCPPPPLSAADSRAITDALSVLTAAERPLIIIGKGDKICPGTQKCKLNSLIPPSRSYKAMKITLANRSSLRTSRKWLERLCRDERTPISAHSHGEGSPSWRPSKLCGCCSLTVRVPP